MSDLFQEAVPNDYMEAVARINYVRNGLAPRHRYADVRAIFVETSHDVRCARSRTRPVRGAIKTTALPGTFEDNIDLILREVGKAFAFFLIDPKGWSGFALEQITKVFRHRLGEVMVNLMYDFINRFINFPEAAN